MVSERRKKQQEACPGSSEEAYNASSSLEPQHMHGLLSLAEDQMKGHVLHIGLNETMCAVSLNP